MRLLAAVLLFLPTLALADVADVVVPLGVVGTVFFFSALIVGIVAGTMFRVRRLRHETIRVALEKGQPVPPDLLEPPRRPPEPLRDLRTGVVLLGVGAGLSAFFYVAAGAHPGAWALGFVPGFVGVGYLVAFALSRLLTPKLDADRG
jgi:hypothetical protein